MFVAQYISFQLQLNLFDHLAAVVGDVDVDVDARPTNPDLPMEACCDANDFQGSLTRFDPLVGCRKWAL
jgi:hypothetical protein